MVENVIIMGAAGRDFHNFNIYFRDNKRYNVVCFTATQIPDIDNRRYPAELSGKRYPQGIPIFSDGDLFNLIKDNKVDLVSFSYSDVPHLEVMHKASIVTAAGADFIIIGAPYTMLKSNRKVISVCAVRTGCGKSPVSRRVVEIVRDMGKTVVAVRHPMPYGDLTKQVVQRFATYEDVSTHNCTVEEREEYEPMIEMGAVIYAGIDYEKILREAEKEADVIVWDGGNNDTPFFAPDIHIVLFDPHRAGHETSYHPGETNMLMADVAIINKVDSAPPGDVEKIRRTIEANNPRASIILAESEITVDHPDQVKDKRVLVVEDGPSLTHGEMNHGAGVIAAHRYGAAELVDPRPYLAGTLKQVFQTYTSIGPLLPAIGYSRRQIGDLEATINNTDCDLVLVATPADLCHLLKVSKPTLRVRYRYKDHGDPNLESILRERLGG